MANIRKLKKRFLKFFHSEDSEDNCQKNYLVNTNHELWTWIFFLFKMDCMPPRMLGAGMLCCSLHWEGSVCWDTV